MVADTELKIMWAPKSRNGVITLSAKIADAVVHVDEGHIAKADFRGKFARAVCKNRPGIDRAAVEAELTRLATEVAEKAMGARREFAPDGEDLHIVRPERFIHQEVSGLAVAERAIVDGRPVGRWALYLRWRDGRRERVDLPASLELPDKSRLWVHPQPGEPLPTAAPRWSGTARRAWLAGAAAPDPAELFRRLCERIAYFLDLPANRAPGIVATLGLWSVLTYIYPTFDAVPYLHVGGPLGSGKSRVFEVLARIVFRPLASSSMTAPCLFRTLHNQGGTLLLDEAERLRQSTPDMGEVLNMLLAGYKRGGRATWLEPVGDSFKTVEFEVYGPKALACIATLPPALMSRCIQLTMFRCAPGSEKPRRRVDSDPQVWQALRDDLHVVALEYGSLWMSLPQRTGLCPAMSGRHFELWQPLLAIADWIESAGAEGLTEIVRQHAMECIESGRDDQLPDADETLLRIVAGKVCGGERFTPTDILTAARELEPEMFKHWMPRTISNRLRQYGIPAPRRSTGGRRVFGGVSRDLLGRIQTNYGMDLGFASLSSLPSPQREVACETARSIPTRSDASDASDESVGGGP